MLKELKYKIIYITTHIAESILISHCSEDKH